MRAGEHMDGVVARDPRIEAILTSPDDYFRRARSRAWAEAGKDVLDELDRHSSRHNVHLPPEVRLEARRSRQDGPAGT